MKMDKKTHYNHYISAIIFIGILCLMLYTMLNAISKIENDKDVWFHKDIKWGSCSCSTEIKEYFPMCMEFIKSCETINKTVES